MAKKLLVFGSTGSIGKSTLDVVRNSRGAFKVLGLQAHKNITLLRAQVKEFKPSYVCVTDPLRARQFKKNLPKGAALLGGEGGLKEFSLIDSDISVMGIMGIASLEPLMVNLAHTRRMALASKEALVTAGALVMAAARRYGTELLPVDSEINALFQLLNVIDRSEVRRLYLTASGGALFNHTAASLRSVKPSDVLAHPTWNMGRRITVDSATLVNKGFEVIESHHLFGMPFENIEVVIHRQSLVHALVQTCDGMLFACLYAPSMKVPIAHSLYYPRRHKDAGRPHFYSRGADCSFLPLKPGQFPLLGLTIEAARRGGNVPVAVNAADEVAVKYFLKGKIRFKDIQAALENIVSSVSRKKVDSVEDVMYWDSWARARTEEFLKQRRSLFKKGK